MADDDSCARGGHRGDPRAVGAQHPALALRRPRRRRRAVDRPVARAARRRPRRPGAGAQLRRGPRCWPGSPPPGSGPAPAVTSRAGRRERTDHLADLRLDGPRPADEARARPGRGHRRPAHRARRVRRLRAGAAASSSGRWRRRCRAEGCWLRVVDTSDDAAAVTVLLARADDLQSADPAYLEELRRWTGRDDDQPRRASPPPPSRPRLPPSVARATGCATSTPTATSASPRWSGEPPRPEHPLVVVLGTDDDDPAAWLAAGQALGRLLLTATVHGLAASPMTQALEVPDTRSRLAAELGLVGHPQMVLRVGRAPEGSTTTGGTPTGVRSRTCSSCADRPSAAGRHPPDHLGAAAVPGGHRAGAAERRRPVGHVAHPAAARPGLVADAVVGHGQHDLVAGAQHHLDRRAPGRAGPRWTTPRAGRPAGAGGRRR